MKIKRKPDLWTARVPGIKIPPANHSISARRTGKTEIMIKNPVN